MTEMMKENMIQPSITISLLPANPRAPFVLGPDLHSSMELAAKIGYPAFELFPPNCEAIDIPNIRKWSQELGLSLSTIGTGGGWVTNQWSLIDPDPAIRQSALDYITRIMEMAAELEASAIVGSMQGRCGGRERASCVNLLGEQLTKLATVAQRIGRPLYYEPLNRYETDLFCTLAETASFLAGLPSDLKILADLFHCNIEETDTAQAILDAGKRVGHVHFVDSNRQVPGRGHTDFKPIVQALKEIQFQGFMAIEAFPLPDSETAARQALQQFELLVGRS